MVERRDSGMMVPSHRNGVSPSSAKAANDAATPGNRSKAPSFTGCRYETGMAFSRRRIPYSIGGDQLDRAKSMPKKFLNAKEEERLTADMQKLYERLLPTSQSDQRRADFINRLDRILNDRWPDQQIKVHVFGSSGNLLCTNDSDVDVCITTTMKSLEKTCLLAAVLAEHGMQRVVCVPQAKVPIVKFWDPRSQLACDMNVNNTLALENTRMIKTYVEIDHRVRPLAMIIKHWTKQRILNDAALGGTLSSYTWICMILNFLQTRNPPILPSLHRRVPSDSSARLSSGGGYAAFDSQIEHLQGFGHSNQETLGELLFQFFRRYGHDVDYERSVVSVREGRLMPKTSTRWHLMQNNRLCVEEPFTVERNLGNTADDISFRGIHLELRRAFDCVAEANLDKCLEVYEFPQAEERPWLKTEPQAMPTMTRTRSQSQSTKSFRTNGGGANRTVRGQDDAFSRNRRASSLATIQGSSPSAPQIPYMRPEISLAAHNQFLQAQFERLKLHRQLFDEMQTLQRQEYELRMKQAQNQLQAEMSMYPLQDSAQVALPRDQTQQVPPLPQIPFLIPPRVPSSLSQLMYPQVVGTKTQNNVQTQPSSPLLGAIQADPQHRNMTRSSVAKGMSSSTHRSHSQPARMMPQNIPMQQVPSFALSQQQLLNMQNMRQYQGMQQEQLQWARDPRKVNQQTAGHAVPSQPSHAPFYGESEPSRNREYAGYWIRDPSSGQILFGTDTRGQYAMQSERYLEPTTGNSLPSDLSRQKSSSPSSSTYLHQLDQTHYYLDSAPNLSLLDNHYQQDPRAESTAQSASFSNINPNTDTSYSSTASGSTSCSEEQVYETPLTGQQDAFQTDLAADASFSKLRARNGELKSAPWRKSYMPAQDQGAQSHTTLTSWRARPMNSTNGPEPVNHGNHVQNGTSTENSFGASHDLVQEADQILDHEINAQDPLHLPMPLTPSGQLSAANDTGAFVSDQQCLVPLAMLSPVREVRTPSPVRLGDNQGITTNPVHVIKDSIIGEMDLRIPAYDELVSARKRRDLATQNKGFLKLKEQNLSAFDTRQASVSPQSTEGSSPPQSNSNGVQPIPSFECRSPIDSNSPRPPHNTPASICSDNQKVEPTLATQVLTGTNHGNVNGWQQTNTRKGKKPRGPGLVNSLGLGLGQDHALPADENGRKGG